MSVTPSPIDSCNELIALMAQQELFVAKLHSMPLSALMAVTETCVQSKLKSGDFLSYIIIEVAKNRNPTPKESARFIANIIKHPECNITGKAVQKALHMMRTIHMQSTSPANKRIAGIKKVLIPSPTAPATLPIKPLAEELAELECTIRKRRFSDLSMIPENE